MRDFEGRIKDFKWGKGQRQGEETKEEHVQKPRGDKQPGLLPSSEEQAVVAQRRRHEMNERQQESQEEVQRQARLEIAMNSHQQ